MRDTTKAKEAKQAIKVYENDDYSIYTIPLNYLIQYKVKNPYKTTKDVSGASKLPLLITQNQYSPLDRGLEYAKETAEYMIKRYLAEY